MTVCQRWSIFYRGLLFTQAVGFHVEGVYNTRKTYLAVFLEFSVFVTLDFGITEAFLFCIHE